MDDSLFSNTHIHVLQSVGLKLNDTTNDDLSIVNEYSREANTNALIRVLQSLGLPVSLHKISLVNYKEVLQSIDRNQSIVFNLCDGTDLDGYLGLSNIQELERLKLKFTTCDSQFCEIAESKLLTKRRLLECGVPTMPFIEITDDTRPKDIDMKLGTYPVIVKPSLSYASMNITRQSVCFNADETLAQARQIRPHVFNGVFAEGFLAGREFTVLLLGDSMHGIKVFPAVERVFNVALPTYERFLAFDRYWDGFKSNDSNKTNHVIDPLYQYRLVSDEENRILTQLAEDAYKALGGNGYARVDMRTSSATCMDPIVLEVNTPCSLSFDIDETTTSAGEILRLCNIDVNQLVRSLIEYAQKRG